MRPVLAAAAVIGALLVGSFLYWQAEGSVGTAEDFQERVAATGLVVEWSNAGPRSGDGLVRGDCGPVAVSVNDIEGVLLVTAGGIRRPLTAAAVRAIQSCPGP